MPGLMAHIVAHRHIIVVAGDNICAATVVCFCGAGGGWVGGMNMERERGRDRQTGQIFNNCIFDDTIKFSSAVFWDRTN